MNVREYKEEIKNDVMDYIRYNKSYETEDDLEELKNDDNLYDELFNADSVTGNASGSYHCNAFKAKEDLYGVIDTEEFKYMISEFCENKFDIYDNGWEYYDVSFRCWLLGEVINDAIDKLIEEMNK